MRRYKKFTVNLYTYKTPEELDNLLTFLKEDSKSIEAYELKPGYIVVE